MSDFGEAMENLTKADEQASISYSSDKSLAYVTFTRPQNGGLPLSADDIKNVIKRNDITYGLDNELIEKISKGPRLNDMGYCVAIGKAAAHGVDGKTEYFINTNKSKSLKPKYNEDGSVNYRDLDLIEVVDKDHVMARITLPTKGQPGMSVLNKEIPANDGRPAPKLPAGRGTRISEDGLELLANVGGQVVITNGIASVSEVLEIRGNVDNSTGNINFNGSVIITGNIITDFRVVALGNIEVQGLIEGAEVMCGGNLVAAKGIIGMHKAKITVKGSLSARMIQDADVTIGGNVISDGIMHCTLKCGGKIELTGKKGILVGGSVIAKEEIDATVIGSPLGTATDIKVGLDSNIYDKYKEYITELNELKKQFEELSKQLAVMSKVANVNSLPEAKKKSYVKTLYDAKHFQERIASKQAQTLEVKAELDKFKNTGKIKVNNVLYPGVNIQIGNAVMNVRDNLQFCILRNDDGRVKVDNM